MAKSKSTSNGKSAAEWKQMLAEADKNWQDYIAQWPPAKSVRYDRGTKRVVVELVNGLRIEVPAVKLQGVANGNERERADVHCIGDGTCLEWKSLDQHFSIEGLLSGRFGNKDWMSALGRANRTSSKVAGPRPRPRQRTAIAKS